MPSDERAARALEALADRVTTFRGALTTARDEMREHLEACGGVEHDRAQTAAWSLGPFASGRIDTRRFGALLADERVLAPASAARLAQCVDVLDELLGRGDALFVHRVPSGGLLRTTIDAALGDAGRAFAAARVFQAVRRGGSPVPAHESMLREFPFALWSHRERDLAPPMVIEIDGADLRAEHLVEYLDGTVRLVLVAGEPAPPAPLVRLIAPNVLVLQTSDERALETLNGVTGPAVAAVLPKGCAELLHDPRKGERLDDRLTIASPAGGATATALGWRSARQSQAELAQLEALAEVCRAARDVAVVVVPPLLDGNDAASGDRAVDAVAAWMLTQAGFTGGVK